MVKFITRASFVDDNGVFRYAGEEVIASKETYDKQVSLTTSGGALSPILLDLGEPESPKQVEPPKEPESPKQVEQPKQPETPKSVKAKQSDTADGDL